MVNLNISLNDDKIEFYTKNFPAYHKGVEHAITSYMESLKDNPFCDLFSDKATSHTFMMDTWAHIWQYFLRKTKEVFTKDELFLLIDLHNGIMLSPIHYGSNALGVGISEACVMDGLDKKWDVDVESILDKVSSLPAMHQFILELWANAFWYGNRAAIMGTPDKEESDNDLSAYVQTLL